MARLGDSRIRQGAPTAGPEDDHVGEAAGKPLARLPTTLGHPRRAGRGTWGGWKSHGVVQDTYTQADGDTTLRVVLDAGGVVR
jgi:hypothetical protein